MTNATQTTETTNAVASAQAKIQSIQQGIVGGNTKITATDLASAKAALEFAELQEAAKEIVRQTHAENARKVHLLTMQKELATVSDSRKSVDAKFDALKKSLDDYLQAATDYQNALNGIRISLRDAEMYPGEQSGAIVGGVEPGQKFFGIQITDVRRKLSIGEVSAENVTPDQEVKPVIERALGEYDRHF